MSDIATRQRGPARRLLIVGDPALSRGLMKMVLSRLDYVVTCVATGGGGDGAAATRFALVMVALHLPDSPGLDLRPPAARARGRPSTPILLFGDAWDQDAVLQAAGGRASTATCRSRSRSPPGRLDPRPDPPPSPRPRRSPA